jgi:translation initiation factor 4A
MYLFLQTCNIIQYLPAKIQIGLFSAAFSSEALETSHWFMDKHVTIKVLRDEELKDIGIKQFYHKVEKEEKLGKLYALFETLEFTRIVIFVNTKQGVKSLIEDVRAKGYAVSASHGGMSQLGRDTAIQEFRAGSSRILIATDLRGTNLGQVPVVINYDLPTQLMQYISRVQQQRRYSETESVAINFVTPADERIVFDIQRFCDGQMIKLPSNPTFELLVGCDVQKCS